MFYWTCAKFPAQGVSSWFNLVNKKNLQWLKIKAWWKVTNAYDFFPHGDSRHYWYVSGNAPKLPQFWSLCTESAALGYSVLPWNEMAAKNWRNILKKKQLLTLAESKHVPPYFNGNNINQLIRGRIYWTLGIHRKISGKKQCWDFAPRLKRWMKYFEIHAFL